MNCPSGAVWTLLTEATGAPPVLRYFDRREGEVRVETEGFDGDAIYQDTEYDDLGRVTDALNNSTSYAHDALGNLLTITHASAYLVTLAYDIRGRKTSMSDPDMGNWRYSRTCSNPPPSLSRRRTPSTISQAMALFISGVCQQVSVVHFIHE